MKELKQCSGFFRFSSFVYDLDYALNRAYYMDDNPQLNNLEQQSGNIADVTAMVERGTAANQRIGNSIMITRVKYRQKITWVGPTFAPLQPYKLMMGVMPVVADDTEQPHAVVTLPDLMCINNGPWFSTLPLNNAVAKTKWKVLYEKMVSPWMYPRVYGNAGNVLDDYTSVIEIDHVFKTPLRVDYHDSNLVTARNHEDLQKNRIMVIGTSLGDANSPYLDSLNGYASIYFYDV